MTTNAAKTHCPRDHEYTSENTYHAPAGSNAGRACRQCRKDRAAEQRRAEGMVKRGEGTHCRKGLHPLTEENILTWRGKGRQCRTCVGHARLARNYGITPEQYEGHFLKQGGLCGGCRNESKLVVDHDHLTGEVRGLLCSPCNLALGHAQDSPDVLKGLLYYLGVQSWTE